MNTPILAPRDRQVVALERILRCEFLIDVHSESGCVSDFQIAIFKISAAGDNLAYNLWVLDRLLNAKIVNCQIDVNSSGVTNGRNIARAVERCLYFKWLSDGRQFLGFGNAPDMDRRTTHVINGL